MNNTKKNYADMDPLDEIRAIKEEISREFPTARAFGDYLRAKYPDARPPATPKPQHGGRRTPTKAKANGHPAMRQRKTAAHA